MSPAGGLRLELRESLTLRTPISAFRHGALGARLEAAYSCGDRAFMTLALQL